MIFALHAKGLRNLSGHICRNAAAMTPMIMAEISKIVDFTSEFQLVCFVAMLLGFFLLSRKSYLVPVAVRGKNGFDPKKQFQRKDFRFGKYTILANIKWSKMLQNADRRLEIPLLPLVSNMPYLLV